jgi:hypothetical protein
MNKTIIFLAFATIIPLFASSTSDAAKKAPRGRTGGTNRPAARTGGTTRAATKARVRPDGTGAAVQGDEAKAAEAAQPAVATLVVPEKTQADLNAEKQRKTLEEKADLEAEMKILEAQQTAIQAQLIAETGTNDDIELAKAKAKAALAEAHVKGKAKASVMTGCVLEPLDKTKLKAGSCSGKMGAEAEHTVEELEAELIRLNTPALLFLK